MKFGNWGAIGAIALGVLLAGGPAIGKGFIKDFRACWTRSRYGASHARSRSAEISRPPESVYRSSNRSAELDGNSGIRGLGQNLGIQSR